VAPVSLLWGVDKLVNNLLNYSLYLVDFSVKIFIHISEGKSLFQPSTATVDKPIGTEDNNGICGAVT
jgi:hypothetical protein